jgi:MFS family permease
MGMKEIADLFIVGFISSGLIGPFLGLYLDKYGRRKGCLTFCVLYAISCLFKLSKNYKILVLGRILGGISTSLLQTGFESWLAAAAEDLAISDQELSKTFAKATFLNGAAAISSGVLSNWLVGAFGLISPFLFAATLLLLTYFLISSSWREYLGKASSWKCKETFDLIKSGIPSLSRQILPFITANSNLF